MEYIVERLTNLANVFKNMGDILSQIGSFITGLGSFIFNLFKFILFAVKTLFNYFVKAFDSIFNDGFFSTLNSGFEYISKYIGGFWTTVLVSLFILAFFLMLFSFIVKIMKGEVSYNSTSNKIKTYNQHKK